MSEDIRDIRLNKPLPHLFDKVEARREAERTQRRVYAEVDARDQKRCRCCGRRGDPSAHESFGRIHRCHIRDASLGGAFSAQNIFSGCWICHALIHAKQLFVIGTDANERLDFDIHEAAVVHVFGTKPLPPHVRIVL